MPARKRPPPPPSLWHAFDGYPFNIVLPALLLGCIYQAGHELNESHEQFQAPQQFEAYPSQVIIRGNNAMPHGQTQFPFWGLVEDCPNRLIRNNNLICDGEQSDGK